jgi:PAS domain S-box-containing protein
MIGKWARCAYCDEKFRLSPVQIAPPREVTAQLADIPVLARAPDPTVSRTMLIPLPGLVQSDEQAMICRLDAVNYGWIDLSEPARAFFGVSVDSLNGPTFFDQLHPDDRTLAEEELRRASELGERHDLVLRFRGASGSWRFVRLDAQARYDRNDGALNHIRCHFVDVTDQIREEQELRRRTVQLTTANEQLRQANERLKEAQTQLVRSEKLAAVGTLAAGMAHELNNPLSFAMNNVAVLERDVKSLLEILTVYQEGRTALDAARPDLFSRLEALEDACDLPYLTNHLLELGQSTRRGLERVAQIVANLRDFAQLDRGRITEVDLNTSIDQAVQLLGEPLSRLHIDVVREYSVLPLVTCGTASINQVLFHLLMNAVHAIEDGKKPAGRIRIVTRRELDELVIEIIDDGCGIAPEVLPRIFDPFFTTKQVGRGAGLGLSISHGIIAEHGGRIEVESVLEQGSLVRVRLPCRGTGPS